MARVQVDLPARFGFRAALPLLADQINGYQHLDAVVLLRLMSDVRNAFLQQAGLLRQPGQDVGLIQADIAVAYRSEARLGETLVFELAAGAFSRCGFDLVFRATVEGSGREVARGKTGMVFFDYGTQQPVPVPAGVVERLQAGPPGAAPATGATP